MNMVGSSKRYLNLCLTEFNYWLNRKQISKKRKTDLTIESSDKKAKYQLAKDSRNKEKRN
jgi:hypothetical protein